MARAYLTRRALFHLEEIDEYSIGQWGEQVAEQYLADILAAIKRIEEVPELLRSRPDCSLRLSFYRAREHLLVCDVVGDDIYILAVWHGRMDLPGRLERLEPQLVHEAELFARKIAKRNRP